MLYVQMKHLRAALFPVVYGASAVASNLHGRLPISGVATHLKEGSVNRPLAPKQIAAMYNLGGEYFELGVVYCNDHKIASSDVSPNHFCIPFVLVEEPVSELIKPIAYFSSYKLSFLSTAKELLQYHTIRC